MIISEHLHLIGIIIAVITVIVGSSGLSDFLDSFAKPNIQILISPGVNDDGKLSILEILNGGTQAATNLSLYLFAPDNITEITNLASTNPILVPNVNFTLELNQTISSDIINGKTFRLFIPKLVSGEGSRIFLTMRVDGNKSELYDHYRADAVYDQGSTASYIVLDLWDSLSPEVGIQKIIRNINSISLPFVIVSLSAVFLYVKISNGRKQKENFHKIINNIIEIRRLLKDNSTSKIRTDIWHSSSKNNEYGLFLNVNICVAIDDFYEKIKKRNLIIENINSEEIIKVNRECVDEANNIIDMIRTTKILKRLSWE